MVARGCWYWLGCVFAFVVVAATARAEDAGAPADGCAPQGGSAVAVAEAVDGDTLRLADGRMVHVAGIEAVKPAGSAGTAGLAEAARSEVARLTGGQAVTLFMRSEDADRYGRFHADVALPDGTLARRGAGSGRACPRAAVPGRKRLRCGPSRGGTGRPRGRRPGSGRTLNSPSGGPMILRFRPEAAYMRSSKAG